jgi:hypothetical protein
VFYLGLSVSFQVLAFKSGHTVGMFGDGANDAPALRHAQMGSAVSTATDVAKSAAGIVLTKPGLAGIVASVRRPRHVTANPDLCAKLGQQENDTGALPRGRSGHDRACNTDSHVDGDYHAHRRPPGHVLDH